MKDASTAFRIPAMLSAGVALWTTYLFGARAWSRRAGLVAAVLLGLMPRVFFHAHLACFDVPIMAMWILCVYVHWRAQDSRSFCWALAVGIVFGLALETKHNAWMLPFVLVPHALFVQRKAISAPCAPGACRFRRASCRWPWSGPSSSSRSGRTSGTTRSLACSGTSSFT